MAQIENKQFLGNKFYFLKLFFLIISLLNYSQEIKQIEIIYAGSFDRDENIYPDGNILEKDKNRKVHLKHEDMNIFSNKSIFLKIN